MQELPPDTKNITGFQPFGVDANGTHAFFGFSLENSPRMILHCDHLMLGKTIIRLQDVAKEAQRRRLEVDPSRADVEVQEARAHPVVRMDLNIDLAGQLVRLTCTTSSGADSELHLPYDLVEKVYHELPTLMDKMRKQQTARKRKN